MKASKWIAFGICCWIVGLIGFLTFKPYYDAHQFCDIRYRHNEISCSHTGVNPFRIWNHEIESDKYQGISRPDFKKTIQQNKLFVHAYPPWHTTFFWFYGWMTQNTCVAIVMLLCVASFVFGITYFKKYSPNKADEKIFFWGLLIMGLANPSASLFSTGNYGCLLLLASILLVEMLRRNCDVVSGVLWAFMMIKPQVGLLFFWPIIMQKKYLTVGVAIIVCLLATLWPAYVYGESPLTLILQTSQIGAPYIKADKAHLIGFAYKSMGENGIIVWMGICFLVCGLLSYLLRRRSSWLIRIMPVLLIFPYWTYSQGHDYLVLWPLYILFSYSLIYRERIGVSLREYHVLLTIAITVMILTFYKNGWGFVTLMKWIDPSGLGWSYRLCEYLELGCWAAFGIWILRKKELDEVLSN